MRMKMLMLVAAMVLGACASETAVASEETASSSVDRVAAGPTAGAVSGIDLALLSVLGPPFEESGATARGMLVLVDEASQPIATGNPDRPVFLLDVTAFTQRDGTTAFDVMFNNASEPDGSPNVSWQCAPNRRGILTTADGSAYQFAENAEADSDTIGFDLIAVGCDEGQNPEAHEASQLFDSSELVIASSGDNAVTITSDSMTWRFAPVGIANTVTSETSISPPTTLG